MPHARQVFSRKLQELCSDVGTNSMVARDLGINRQQFARYLNGTTMPRPDLVNRMAEYFGVTVGDMFSTNSNTLTAPSTTAEGPEGGFAAVMAGFKTEQVSEDELPSGFYMLYQQSFLRPQKVLARLMAVKRHRGTCIGSTRFSVLHRKHMPGVDFSLRSHVTIAKLNGFIVTINANPHYGALTICSFKMGSDFSPLIKPGLHMTTGRAGSTGPVAGRLVLVNRPRELSPYGLARQQGFFDHTELDPNIRSHLEGPNGETASVYAIS